MPLSVPSAQNNNQKHCIMRKRVLLFVLSSVLMTFCISAQDYAVKGSVWDFDTAEPICSVAVSVYQITGNDTTFYGGCSTDDNGSFIIGQLKAGNYVLHAKSDNHFNTSKSFTLSSENVKDLGKITMRAGTGDLDPAITAVVAKIVDYFPENVYVDLGLSVKWATCNVGADKPEDYGDYYAWGELTPKESYTWENYRFRTRGYDEGTVRLSKYTSICYTGLYDENGISIADDKTLLEPEDDVARVKWGGNWRLPTDAEMNELIDSCTWTWTTLNGVNGCLVTSNRPGYTERSIFLPAAGKYAFEPENKSVGIWGYYWSSSVNRNETSHSAGVLCFGSSFDAVKRTFRNHGQSIRPVCP